ncbi:MAG TPA: DUF5682 family protein [Lacunisphaera sp.]|nr:DUF5682 family protein [Lacunisphaera sp.]
MSAAAEPAAAPPLDPRIWSCTERVVFFPVRHHSPACARLLEGLIADLRPAAVLVEGPADFNPRLAELDAEHQPPLAIYSYFATATGERRGAFYPFCDFSPEWVALREGRKSGASVAFIDLPWVDVAPLDRRANRYADGRLGRARYTQELCRRLGVDDWNTLWDTLFEIDPELSVADYLRRCHSFCHHARIAEAGASLADVTREAFMGVRIRDTLAQTQGQVLVVTGGFHCPALFAALHGLRFEEPTVDPAPDEPPPEIRDRGIALTPYSYARIDSLVGYESGLPNPGFYHQIWKDRASGQHAASHRHLLAAGVRRLREKQQTANTADLIAVETAAQALAALRGHAVVWRTDLVDAMLGGLVKDDLTSGSQHPLLTALNQVFRGTARGRLAAGTPQPPLVTDIQRTLRNAALEPDVTTQTRELALDRSDELALSQTLHRLRVLGIPGFERVAGTDFVGRGDLSRLWEKWSLRWMPEFDAACIECSVYGASLGEATGARLVEQAIRLERDAEGAARLLLDSALAGWAPGFAQLHQRVVELVRTDAAFTSVAKALEHLFYLYRHDEYVGRHARPEVGLLLTEAQARALWLLEAQAQVVDHETLDGVRALLQAVHLAGDELGWDRTELVNTLTRLGTANTTAPLLRGAAAGALWSLGTINLTAILHELPAAPDHVGDFLRGVFALAREEAQRNTDLLVAIDRLLLSYDDEQFLVALPSLRLAFTYFTPREKDHLARRLLQAVGQAGAAPLPALAVSPGDAARALGFESRLLRDLARHGLRGAGPFQP